MFGNDSYPIAIEKHGSGTWTLTGTVANGGTFTVAAGGVEFRNGLANVSSLTVASGASALFAGDMGSNPVSFASGSTLKLDASNEGDDVPVVNGNLDLTGVSVYVSQGTYVPSKTEPRELLRVAGALTGFDRNSVSTDIAESGWAFRVVDNGDGTKSIVHSAACKSKRGFEKVNVGLMP
jgi:autotransporter-associated beta strand protein